MESSPVLVEVTRGPLVESRHRGQLAVVDARGRLTRALGDPEVMLCLRSLAKPFQALAVLTTGAAQAFGFGPEELALFSGSLSGQEFHVALVSRVLARLGLSPADLQCGAMAPLHRPSAQALAQAGEKPGPLHHTCAGKHAMMLALCRHQGWPTPGYYEAEHPVQRLMHRTVAQAAGLSPEEVPLAVDGCGVPTFYLPLKHAALAFARLATAPPGSPEALIREAALAHPRLIAGEGRLETILMEQLPGRVLAKTGAEGSFALSLVREGLGVVLKIEDGAARALNPAILEAADQMGLLGEADRQALAAYRMPVVRDHLKREVGRLQPVFTLA
jgi:L-asparaginase II